MLKNTIIYNLKFKLSSAAPAVIAGMKNPIQIYTVSSTDPEAIMYD